MSESALSELGKPETLADELRAIADQSENLPESSFVAIPLSALPGVWVLDFSDISTLDRAFQRLAIFAEGDPTKFSTMGFQPLAKATVEGRLSYLLSINDARAYTNSPGVGFRPHNRAVDSDLVYFSAHDYSTKLLAAFFSTATLLQKEEQALLEFLLDNELLTKSTTGYSPDATQAIIALSQDCEAASSLPRIEALSHEANHGLWFVCDDFRERVRRYYHSLSVREREVFQEFLAADGNYDLTFEDLVMREFAAYAVTPEISDFQAATGLPGSLRLELEIYHEQWMAHIKPLEQEALSKLKSLRSTRQVN